MSITIEQIDKATEKFSASHDELSELAWLIQKQQQAVIDHNMKRLRKLVADTAKHQGELKSLIEGAPELFEKPRTITVHGVKVGLQKGKGGIEIADVDRTVELIKKVFVSNSPDYLIVTELPDKKALEKVDVHTLKKVGCNVIAADDQVVIKPVSGDVGKVVSALLKDATEEAA